MESLYFLRGVNSGRNLADHLQRHYNNDMATHPNKKSMLKESLPEMILVAEYCVTFRKDPKVWGSGGCYGYPPAVLLLSIADSIGSYILGGSVRNHFNILNNTKYYNLHLSASSIGIIYKDYRCKLTHNTVMAPEIFLDIGTNNDDVFELQDGKPYFNLTPFLEVSKQSIKYFLATL
ncbi:MAG: hypothetical protein DMG65_19635 [Candidatus Angelobacter sp. Gp1-AA117]|nr:MAG: hypothetical protein DMG65_19635 [Candidatus Angelobacter sp. Gp1-AA117]